MKAKSIYFCFLMLGIFLMGCEGVKTPKLSDVPTSRTVSFEDRQRVEAELQKALDANQKKLEALEHE